jgi:hypothetical protein
MSGIFNLILTEGSSSTALVLPTYNGNTYGREAINYNPAASLKLRYTTTGTWSVIVGSFPIGIWTDSTTRSGNWATGTLFAGGYDFRAVSNVDDDGVQSNYDTGWLALSTDTDIVQSNAESNGPGSYVTQTVTSTIYMRERGGNSYVQVSNIILVATIQDLS